MQAGLDIFEELPRRDCGPLDGPPHLHGRKVSDLTGHAAESGLFRRRIVQFPRHIFERAALHHAELVAEPLGIFRVHLRELLDQVEENPFSRLPLREGETHEVTNPGGFIVCGQWGSAHGRRTFLASVNWLKARKRYVLARRVMSGALSSGTLVLRSPTSPSVTFIVRIIRCKSGRLASIRISTGENASRKAVTSASNLGFSQADATRASKRV